MPSLEMEARLRRIVSEQLGVDEDQIVPAASFTDDLNADSLDLVELIMAIEEEFGIEIPDDEAERMVRVEDALNYLTQHISS